MRRLRCLSVPSVKETAPGPLLVPQATLGWPAPEGPAGTQQVLRAGPGMLLGGGERPVLRPPRLAAQQGQDRWLQEEGNIMSPCESLPPGGRRVSAGGALVNQESEMMEPDPCQRSIRGPGHLRHDNKDHEGGVHSLGDAHQAGTVWEGGRPQLYAERPLGMDRAVPAWPQDWGRETEAGMLGTFISPTAWALPFPRMHVGLSGLVEGPRDRCGREAWLPDTV